MRQDFDDVLERVGGFGFIQCYHFSVLILTQIAHAPAFISLAFVGKEPTFACRGRPGSDPCKLVPPCEKFTYGTEFTSIVSEWDLVCERKRDASYCQSLVMLGFLAGVIVLGQTSDKYGRLRTFVGGVACLVAVQLASGFAQNIYQYCFSRFLVGFFSGGGTLAGHVLMLEGLVSRHRASLSTIYHCGFALGLALLAAMAYFVRDWRQLTFVTCLPFLTFIAVPLVVPESARWLASNGRVEEAREQLLDFGRRNGLRLGRSAIALTDKTDDAKGKSSSEGATDLFRTPVLRRRMTTLMIIWFSCCLVYYGLTFGASNLGGDMYVNFALSGIVEVPASLLSILTLNWIGRRPTVAGSLFVVGFSCLGVMALPRSEDGAMSTRQTCLALIGKMGISIAFNSVYLFSSEILPTVLRNTAMGVCSMSARVGGIIAPTLTPFGDTVAYFVFGVTTLLSALLALSLPESLRKQLPETVLDVENGLVTVAPLQEKRTGMS